MNDDADNLRVDIRSLAAGLRARFRRGVRWRCMSEQCRSEEKDSPRILSRRTMRSKIQEKDHEAIHIVYYRAWDGDNDYNDNTTASVRRTMTMT